MTRARVVRAALGAALAVALAACPTADRGPRSRPAGAATPRTGGTLHVAAKEQISTLDPTIANDEASGYVVHPLFDTLVDYEPSSADDPARGLHLVPHLAERWQVSADGLRLEFWLRPGITYADGTPIVAADFQYSLERALTTPQSVFGSYLRDIAGATDVQDGKAAHARGIVVRGERELAIELARPNVAAVYLFAMSFATPQRAAHVAAAGDRLRREPLASGPYELVTWDEGERVVLRANPHYWDRANVHVAAIELRENVARDTQFLMFERGELDAVDQLAAPDYLWISSRADWRPYVYQRAPLNAYGSRMNVRRPPFDDRRVRQALNYALDKRHVVRLLNAAASPSHGLLAPGMAGRDPALAPYPHDPAKARALLAAAGHADGLALDYITTADEDAEKLAQSLQSDLAEVGVRVRVGLVTFATYQTITGDPDGPAFSLATWVGDYPDPTNFLDARFHSRSISATSSNNDSFYASAELDALLDGARAEPDPDRRAALYRRAERVLYDDAPWIWGYHQLRTEIVQPYVRGFAPHPVWLRDYASAWLDLGDDDRPVPR